MFHHRHVSPGADIKQKMGCSCQSPFRCCFWNGPKNDEKHLCNHCSLQLGGRNLWPKQLAFFEKKKHLSLLVDVGWALQAAKPVDLTYLEVRKARHGFILPLTNMTRTFRSCVCVVRFGCLVGWLFGCWKMLNHAASLLVSDVMNQLVLVVCAMITAETCSNNQLLPSVCSKI